MNKKLNVQPSAAHSMSAFRFVKGFATAMAMMLCIAAGLTLLPAYPGSSPTSLAMETRHGPVTPGTFHIGQSTDVVWRPARHASYAPSPEIERATQHSTINHAGVPRRVFTYVPANVTSSAPLVVLFHGGNRTGLSMIEMWRNTADRHGVVLVAPDAIAGGWPHAAPNAGFLHQLIEQTNETHDIDMQQVFLFGHSNGARYVQVMLNRAKGPWKSAAAHAGFLKTEYFHAPARAKPFRLYLGDRDHLFGLPDARDTLAHYASLGHDTSLVTIPGHNHWFYEIGPRIAEASWRWFQSTSRDP